MDILKILETAGYEVDRESDDIIEEDKPAFDHE